MIDFGLWGNVPLETLPRLLDGGASNLNDLKSSDWLIREIGKLNEPKRILDFGCGVGRDIVGMVKAASRWNIVGYDSRLMIAQAKSFVAERGNDSRVDLLDDWNKVLLVSQLKTFDTIFCNLVLQHIPEMQLRWYLRQFPAVGEELFVYGRRAIDRSNTSTYGGGEDFESVWQILHDSGYEMTDAQKGFNMQGNGNDHHWARLTTKEKNVREHTTKSKEQRRHGLDAAVGV